MDVVEFFQQSAGKWQSQRTTHHLAFKRSEMGNSQIQVEALAADHPKIKELCELHQIDPHLAVSGSHVSWQGSMSWDRENEGNHVGETVFALVPDTDNPRQGRLLRERGYAEIMPVVGRYLMDDDGGLVLTTEYETMSSIERFWFASPNFRMRTSTVKRFGGFSSTSFCTESRIEADSTTVEGENSTPEQVKKDITSKPFYSLLGW
jgi:hypothetical protein